MDEIPYPTSLAEVEALITALYSPGPPARVQQIQDVLHRVQKSEGGWQLAESLLSNQDEKIRFFGALTFIVKLNTASSSLSDEQAIGLLHNLIGWFLKAAVEDVTRSQLLMLKLSSALSTWFIYFSRLWKHPVRHIVQCFDVGRCIPVHEFDDGAPVWTAANSLSWDKLVAVICLASDIADGVDGTDPKSGKFADLNTHTMENAKDVAELLFVGMDLRHGEKNDEVGRNALRCFMSWIVYARTQESDTLYKTMRPLFNQLIRLTSDHDLWAPAVENLTDMLDTHSAFWTEEFYQELFSLFRSEHFHARYRAVLQGDFDYDNEVFVWLMIGYGNARVSKLIESTDEQAQLFLKALVDLTGCPGYIAAEDNIFTACLEFWSTFVEDLTDVQDSSEGGGQPWFNTAMGHVREVLSNCWRKIQWPPATTLMAWDSNERARFVEARKDVADMLEAVFALTGPPLVSTFVDLLVLHLSSTSWPELEASAFCVASLADCISDEDTCDDMISKVFSKAFFDLLLQGAAQVPLRVRHTALQLIERYSNYFERRPEFLASALNLLFGGLGDPAIGGDSAKYIAKLCSSCRQILTGEVPAFLSQFGAIYHSAPLDPLAEERVVLAIASIIQAVSNDGEKLSVFAQLFNFARLDIERSIQLAANPQTLNLDDPLYKRGIDPDEPAAQPTPAAISIQLALRALRSISGMAKGMQSIRDGPVDLDAAVSPWETSNELAALQNSILTILNQALVTFATNGEVVEVICNIFRAGFSESEPGPFVFPPAIVSSFFTSLTINAPRIGTVVSTACSFLSSLFKGPAEYLVPTLSQLLPWVISLIQALPEANADTELTQHSIDVVRRLMAKAPQVLFQLQPPTLTEFFFLFTLEVLNGSEPLPKAAAAEFWTEFLALRSDEDPALQASIHGAMEHLGPLVARSLMRNLGGEAMRSELDKLSEPLKKLVVQHVKAQSWLEAALMAEDFPSDKVSAEEKRAFVKKVVNLRGGRQTNVIVREFWLACRGSNFLYAS